MKLICPSCGATHSADAWLNDAIARQCLVLAGSMQHDISSRCFAYLSLFRPAGRALQWKKVLRLLTELQALVSMSDIKWEGKPARTNSSRAWGIALDRVIESPPRRLPLKSHGYLRAVAYDLADELDRQSEVKRNKSEREGTFRRKQGKNSEPERISFEEMKKVTNENYRNRKK